MKTTFAAWLETARPNETLIYHAGLNLQNADPDAVVSARKAYNAGLVELVQRRQGGGKFEYLAVKRAVQAKRQPYFLDRHLVALTA
jgi:hypothetical protein